MSKVKLSRPCALSIAGLDPSAGAGLLADIKTFEASGVLGLGVCSALTYQNDEKFVGLEWVTIDTMLRQLDPIVERYVFDSVKIGLIENLAVLDKLVSYLQAHLPNVKIIWDPVARASAGFTFHEKFELGKLRTVVNNLTLITPNRDEQQLFEDPSGVSLLDNCSCAVLKKSEHVGDGMIGDLLRIGAESFEFKGRLFDNSKKHGSGCVLSAAICAALAKGESLFSACGAGRRYSERFLSSSNNLVGYHAAL